MIRTVNSDPAALFGATKLRIQLSNITPLYSAKNFDNLRIQLNMLPDDERIYVINLLRALSAASVNSATMYVEHDTLPFLQNALALLKRDGAPLCDASTDGELIALPQRPVPLTITFDGEGIAAMGQNDSYVLMGKWVQYWSGMSLPDTFSALSQALSQKFNSNPNPVDFSLNVANDTDKRECIAGGNTALTDMDADGLNTVQFFSQGIITDDNIK